MITAGISELRAHLSRYLRAVRRGETITVLNRKTAIAKIVPVDTPGLRVRKPASNSLHNVPLPPPLDLSIDALELLLEERHTWHSSNSE